MSVEFLKSKRFLGLLLCGITLLYVGISYRLFEEMPIIRWGDTDVYDQISYSGYTSNGMLVGQKPPTLPIVYRFFERDDRQIANFQWAASTLAWVFLGATLVLILKNRWIKVLAYALILSISLSYTVFMWHSLMLSESLSNSLMVIGIGGVFLALWYLKHSPKVTPFQQIGVGLLLVGIWTGWGFIRDPNGYFLLGCAGLIGLILLGSWLKWRQFRPYFPFMLAVIVGCVFIFGMLSRTANAMGRWKPSIYIVTAQFILPDADSTQFFVDKGMPDPATIRQFEGKLPPWESEWPESYDLWIENGNVRRVYIEYLLWNTPDSFLTPLKNWQHIYTPNLQEWAKWEFKPTALQKAINTVFYTPSGFWLLAILLITGALISYLAVAQRLNVYFFVPLFLLLTLYPLTFMIWFSSGGHTDRHAITVNVQLRLTVLLFVLLGLDSFMAVRQATFSWRGITPTKLQTRLAMLAVPLVLLEIIFRLPLTQNSLILPVATQLSANNILKTWDVPDARYFAFRDNLPEEVADDAVMVSSFSEEKARVTLVHTEGWQITRDRDIEDVNIARAVIQWRETALPEYLVLAGIDYVYIEKSWLEEQETLKKLALENPSYYELMQAENGRLLYRVQDESEWQTVTANIETFGLSEINYQDFLAYRENWTLMEANSTVFSPMVGLDWFDSAAELGVLVEALNLQGEARYPYFDLMIVLERRITTHDFSEAEKTRYQNWQTTRYGTDLAALGVEYLLVNDLWMSYLTTDEFYIFTLSTHYQQVAEWSANLPGFYRLYQVISPSSN